jgi:hypothetical protein
VFKLLGILVALNVVYALSAGQVYARRGPWGALWKRSEHTFNYWAAVTVYSGLSVALFFVF